jgi:hypothetical protein
MHTAHTLHGRGFASRQQKLALSLRTQTWIFVSHRNKVHYWKTELFSKADMFRFWRIDSFWRVGESTWYSSGYWLCRSRQKEDAWVRRVKPSEACYVSSPQYTVLLVIYLLLLRSLKDYLLYFFFGFTNYICRCDGTNMNATYIMPNFIPKIGTGNLWNCKLFVFLWGKILTVG